MRTICKNSFVELIIFSWEVFRYDGVESFRGGIDMQQRWEFGICWVVRGC